MNQLQVALIDLCKLVAYVPEKAERFILIEACITNASEKYRVVRHAQQVLAVLGSISGQRLRLR